MNTQNGNNFSYEIVKPIAVIDESRDGKYTLEANLVSYNGKPAKIDIRRWNRETGQMLKGITLRDDQARALVDALGAFLDSEGSE